MSNYSGTSSPSWKGRMAAAKASTVISRVGYTGRQSVQCLASSLQAWRDVLCLCSRCWDSFDGSNADTGSEAGAAGCFAGASAYAKDAYGLFLQTVLRAKHEGASILRGDNRGRNDAWFVACGLLALLFAKMKQAALVGRTKIFLRPGALKNIEERLQGIRLKTEVHARKFSERIIGFLKVVKARKELKLKKSKSC